MVDEPTESSEEDPVIPIVVNLPSPAPIAMNIPPASIAVNIPPAPIARGAPPAPRPRG
jgi:hypothetical protein